MDNLSRAAKGLAVKALANGKAIRACLADGGHDEYETGPSVLGGKPYKTLACHNCPSVRVINEPPSLGQ